MAHKVDEPYSGKNPVPQMVTKLTSLINPEHATEAKAAQLQDQSDREDRKQTKKRAKGLAKGYVMHVTDPVTGAELDITNADEDLDLRNKGGNVLETDFPLPDWKAHRDYVVSLVAPNIIYIALAYTLSFLASRLISNSFLSITLALVLPTSLAYILFFRINTLSQNDFDDRVWDSERMRGLQAGSDLNGDGKVEGDERTKEGAEWANAVLRGVWPIVNPDLFATMMDILEDIMQSSAPGFVHSVRVSDLGFGSNAARITAIHSLPDPQGQNPQDQKGHDMREELDRSQDESSQNQEQAPDDQHVNLEVSFAYRGLPSGKSARSKAKNIHLLVEFFLGLRGWYGFKVPVWVEVNGVIGTARARLQLISDPPFIKTTLITLLGLPRVTISVVPMSRLLPNVMNLPFISGFVSDAINTAVAEYVAPKSLTLDLQRLISGDDIKKDTEAIGVLVVHIHRAIGVKSMDAGGGSDPYVTLTYSRLGKPLYSTRIIKNDCNPVFEETAIILVDVNAIRLHEKLSFQLWDSDRMSVDDLLGIVDHDIADLVRNHGKPFRRREHLSHPHNKHVPGEFEYTLGYYGKLPPTDSLRTSGVDPGIPEDLQDNPEFKQARAVALNDLEAAVLVTPPDPEWPSGILSIQVHEIRGVGVKKEGRERNVLKSASSREGEKGQDDDVVEEEEAEGLPSSYCMISLNDELVYQTRAKPITGSPIFNAGTERFVRDWRTAHVSVTVKDSRMRENDAILGLVMLKLSDLFVNASQVTRLYSLEEGLGYGRIRISLLFRAVEAKLPPTLLGFDTGTMEVHDLSVKLNGQMDMDLTKCEVRLKTTKSGANEKVSRKTAHQQDDGTVMWTAEQADLKAIPVRERYGSALLMSFRDKGSTGLKHSGRQALAMLWMRDIADNDERTIEIPLYHVTDGDYSRLKMNYTPLDGNLDMWDSDKEKVQRVGSVYVCLVFKPGMGEGHQYMMDGGKGKRKEAWEAFVREQAGGLRDSVGEMEDTTRDMPKDYGLTAESVEPSPVNTAGSDSQMQPNAVPAQDDANPPPIQVSRPGLPGTQRDSQDEPSNTFVSSQAVENASLRRSSSSGRYDDDEDHGSSSRDDEEDGGEDEKKPGVIQKFKTWRKHEKELHREHRGIMQVKPMRTADWIKDNIEEGLHDVKERFSMKSQKPDIETEV